MSAGLSSLTKNLNSNSLMNGIVLPTERVAVRRVPDMAIWFVPNHGRTGTTRRFLCGVLIDVVFNPNAAAMPDVICRSNYISKAEATGRLVAEGELPNERLRIRKKCLVGFNEKTRVFYDLKNPRQTLSRADQLNLYTNGSACALWFEWNT